MTGGAVYVAGSGSPRITDCTFKANRVFGNGGAIQVESSTPAITHCLFTANVAANGGAVSNLQSNSHLTNCTICGNRAVNIAGGVYNTSCSPVILNSILWDHRDANGNAELAQIDGGTPQASYSCIHHLLGIHGTGNLTSDPCFAEPGYWDDNGTVDDPADDVWMEGDYHLKSQAGRWDKTGKWIADQTNSPCIDAGSPATLIDFEPFPNGGIVNIGYYGGTAQASKSYFGKPPCKTIVTGDLNGDCRVDWRDFTLMLGHWLEENS